jgi:transposase
MLNAWQISEEDWSQTPASVRAALVTLDRHVLRLDARCAIYLRQVERLQAEVEALKPLQAEVVQLRECLGLNSRNSSRPPSSDPPRQRRKRKHESSGRQIGGQPGHSGHHRPLQPESEVDQIIDLRPECCRQCGGLLLGDDPAPARRQVSEIPRCLPQVTEYRRHTLTCVTCGFLNRAEWPEEMPKGSFGPRAQALVAFLTGRIGASQRDVVEVLQTVYGLKISLGSIPAIQKQVSAAIEPAVQAAQDYIQRQPVNYVDETTWPESGAQHWLWVNAAEKATIFKLLAGRGQSEARQVIGSDYAGIAASDRCGRSSVLIMRGLRPAIASAPTIGWVIIGGKSVGRISSGISNVLSSVEASRQRSGSDCWGKWQKCSASGIGCESGKSLGPNL